MGQRTVRQIQDWSEYLRTVANNLIGSDPILASRFDDVHNAVGPKGLTKSNVFELDTDYLMLFQNPESSEEVMRGFIESLETVIREGDKLGPEFMNRSVWNSGLKDYLKDLLAKLTQ